jgi:hypothetical protein
VRYDREYHQQLDASRSMTALAIAWEALQTLGALAGFAALALVLPERVRFWRSRWRRNRALTRGPAYGR